LAQVPFKRFNYLKSRSILISSHFAARKTTPKAWLSELVVALVGCAAGLQAIDNFITIAIACATNNVMPTFGDDLFIQ